MVYRPTWPREIAEPQAVRQYMSENITKGILQIADSNYYSTPIAADCREWEKIAISIQSMGASYSAYVQIKGNITQTTTGGFDIGAPIQVVSGEMELVNLGDDFRPITVPYAVNQAITDTNTHNYYGFGLTAAGWRTKGVRIATVDIYNTHDQAATVQIKGGMRGTAGLGIPQIGDDINVAATNGAETRVIDLDSYYAEDLYFVVQFSVAPGSGNIDIYVHGLMHSECMHAWAPFIYCLVQSPQANTAYPTRLRIDVHKRR
jgi:hypothetical protein